MKNDNFELAYSMLDGIVGILEDMEADDNYKRIKLSEVIICACDKLDCTEKDFLSVLEVRDPALVGQIESLTQI